METFLNDKGERIESASLLNEKEIVMAEKLTNAVSERYGYLVPMTTLTAVLKSLASQKFYEIPVNDYLPVRVGTEAAWARDMLMFRSFQIGGDFEKGYIETGNEGRLASTDVTLDAVRVPIRTWAKELTWSIADVAEAARTGIWDIVTQKEKARRTNWNLGIQKTAFLGSRDGKMEGLATLSDVNINTTLVPANLPQMTDAEFTAFVGNLVGAYLQNNDYTQMPNRLYIPLKDFVALNNATSIAFPIKSKIEYLRDALRATAGQDFEIKPLAYLQTEKSDGKLNADRYILMRYDEEVARFEIPVDYTVTVPNSIEGWTIRNAAYGQHSGVLSARPQEILYLDKTENS